MIQFEYTNRKDKEFKKILYARRGTYYRIYRDICRGIYIFGTKSYITWENKEDQKRAFDKVYKIMNSYFEIMFYNILEGRTWKIDGVGHIDIVCRKIIEMKRYNRDPRYLVVSPLFPEYNFAIELTNDFNDMEENGWSFFLAYKWNIKLRKIIGDENNPKVREWFKTKRVDKHGKKIIY